MKFEYLLFNIVVLFGPLILSRVPIFFAKKPFFSQAIIAISIPAFFFLVWDALVTDYFWSFNTNYILGYRLYKLPIEEILFFFTVPYSCLFLWINWKKNIQDSKLPSFNWLLIIATLLILPFVIHLIYTSIVLGVFVAIVLLDKVIKTQFFMNKQFISFLGIVLLLTFISNGYLTARPIVLYNELVKTNIQITTIPIEDFIYGIALIAFVVILYEKQLQKLK